MITAQQILDNGTPPERLSMKDIKRICDDLRDILFETCKPGATELTPKQFDNLTAFMNAIPGGQHMAFHKSIQDNGAVRDFFERQDAPGRYWNRLNEREKAKFVRVRARLIQKAALDSAQYCMKSNLKVPKEAIEGAVAAGYSLDEILAHNAKLEAQQK